jgi:hypothetical protein
MALGDDVVIIPPVTGTGLSEAIVIQVGKNRVPLAPINTGGKNLRINITSGTTTFSVAVNKRTWHLSIVEDV